MKYTKENILNGSYKGKDLLEASSMPTKASLEFKDIMSEVSKNLDILNNHPEEITKKIKDFSLFVYGNEERAMFFTEKVLIAML